MGFWSWLLVGLGIYFVSVVWAAILWRAARQQDEDWADIERG